MAGVLPAQITLLWESTGGEKVRVYRITNVTSADTLDLATLGFAKVFAAVFACMGELTGALCGLAATTVTFTLATMANDTIIVTVRGSLA